MIARLSGTVVALEDGALILDVAGVGYRVHVPAGVLAEQGRLGETATLLTHLHLRENEMELFGAADAATLSLFKQLLAVSGIGPKLALAVLSALDLGSLRRAILTEDLARLTEVPGIGRKTAARMVLDLKSRLEAEGLSPEALGAGGTAARPGFSDDAEALEALLALGYSRPEARRGLATVDPGLPLEERLVAALRALASG